MVLFVLAKVIKKYCLHGILNAEYKNSEKLESALGKCGYHGNSVSQMFTKHTQISASNIKSFSSYAQKTTWGGTKCPPPPPG